MKVKPETKLPMLRLSPMMSIGEYEEIQAIRESIMSMPVPAATVHTSRTTRVQSRPQSRTPTTVSITDIYNTIENKNYKAQSQSRRSSVQNAQAKTLFGYSRVNNHRDARETQSLPGNSRARTPDVLFTRPQTARETTEEVLEPFSHAPRSEPEEDDSRCMSRSEVGEYILNASVVGDNVDLNDVAFSDVQSGRQVTSFSEPAQYAASRGFCVRSRSALLRETDGLVSSLSRQCCDVLGPKLCHECAIIKRRSRDTRRYESDLPMIHMSDGNLATTLLIAKNYPHMPMEDIQMKLARGDIMKPVFKYNVQRMTARREKEPNQTALVKYTPKPRISRNAQGATYNYFSSIQDLNKKIVSGKLIRKIILTGDPQRDLTERPVTGQDQQETFSQSVTPCFVSARKGKPDKRRVPMAYEPPLVPKVCQVSDTHVP